MSKLLCCGSSSRGVDVSAEFHELFETTDVSNVPIGRAVVSAPEGNAFLITHNSCSTDLFDAGYWREQRSAQFIDCFGKLVERYEFVSVLAHWFTGDVRRERVAVARREVVTLTEFVQRFPSIEEDVRYAVSK